MRVEPRSGLNYEILGQGRPRALLVLLHGVGGQETDLMDLGTRLDPGIHRVLPRGSLIMSPGRFAWFEVTFGPRGPVIDAGQAEASRRQLAALVAALQETTGVGPARTVIAGFSQGGILAASVALSRPDLVAGFGILSGRILPELEPAIAAPERLAGIAGFVGHGREDPVLPVIWADRSDDWLGRLGVPCESHRYSGGHELMPTMARDFQIWVLDRLGFTSPAG